MSTLAITSDSFPYPVVYTKKCKMDMFMNQYGR
jgi:hypothetical protein